MSRILNVSEQLVIQSLFAKGFSIRRFARELWGEPAPGGSVRWGS